MKLYGEKLKEIREKTGISIKYIVNQLNISRKTYWNWESGKVKPTGKKIKDLAKVLNISVSMISDLTDKQFSDKSMDKTFEFVSHNYNNTAYDENIFSTIKDSVAIVQKKQIYNSAIIEILLSSINAMFYVKNIDLKYILANELFLKTISGSTETSCFKKTDRDFFSRTEADKNTAEDTNVLITGKPVLNREGYIPGTKKKKYGLISKFPVMDENSKIMGVVASIIDITGRKKEEKQRIVLEHIINKLEEAVWFLESDSTDKDKFFINTAVENITGIKAEEFYKDPYVTYKYCHPEFKDALKNFHNRKNHPAQIEYKLTRPNDKTERWIKQISYQEDNLKFGIGYDITEQKNNQEVKDLLKVYMDIAKHGMTITELKTGKYLYMNDSCSVIYGRTVDEMLKGGYQFWLDHCVYGEDKEYFKRFNMVNEIINYNLSNKILKYKIIRPDSQVRLIYCETSTIKFKGRFCALYVEYDITEENHYPKIPTV